SYGRLPTPLSTLSLHDALPIFDVSCPEQADQLALCFFQDGIHFLSDLPPGRERNIHPDISSKTSWTRFGISVFRSLLIKVPKNPRQSRFVVCRSDHRHRAERTRTNPLLKDMRCVIEHD